MKKRKYFIILLLIIIFLILGLLFAGLFYRTMRNNVVTDRPLVIIQTPRNHQEGSVGEGMMLLASARAASGISQMEFWVDGILVNAREAELAFNPMILSSSWLPTTNGEHIVTARAVSGKGVEGQSTIVLHINEEIIEEAGDEAESVEEIENEEIAADDGHFEEAPLIPDHPTPPEIGPEPPRPDIPDEPALPEDDAPGSMHDLLEYLGLGPLEIYSTPEEVTLRVEVLELTTGRDFDSLHCYMSLEESTPRWYPDVDGDQSTDETFSILPEGGWDVSPHLAGVSAPFITLMNDQDLDVNINCVGGLGGIDSLNLGEIALSLSSDYWNGIIREAVSSGEEAGFNMKYRVAIVPEHGAIPTWLDPDMDPPFNLHLGFYTLEWEYERDEEEEPIDGFRIYLNNTFMWTEPADARRSLIPPEWFNPPCGQAYTLMVTAYRYEFPDGPESRPSNPVEILGDDLPCDTTVMVLFERLRTYDYIHEFDDPEENEVGPIYGLFYVNDQVIGFDGRCSDGSCTPLMLEPDENYSAAHIAGSRGSIGARNIVIDVPAGEDLLVGYEIYDQDSGSAQQLCHAEHLILNDRLDELHDEWMGDWVDDNCGLKYVVRPTLGSPVEGSYGGLPLPLLGIADLTVHADTGQLQIHVRNSGEGTWPGKDLTMVIKRHNGSPLGVFVEEEFVLFPGENKMLSFEGLAPEHPTDVCIQLDPGNDVPEESEGLGWDHRNWCYPLPDLLIEDVKYDYFDDRLMVLLRNLGDGPFRDRDIDLRIDLPDGSWLDAPEAWWSNMRIDEYERVWVEWPGISEEQREVFRDGYTVRIDPDNFVAETNEDNNAFEVPAGARLKVVWRNVQAQVYPFTGSPDTEEMIFDLAVYVENGSETLSAPAFWSFGPIDVEPGYIKIINPHQETTFEVYGDEYISIYGSGQLEYRGTNRFMGSFMETFSVSQDWGATYTISEDEVCNYDPAEPSSSLEWWILPTSHYWQGCDPWLMRVVICKIQD
ncbi:MAG: hypothetical protein JEZ06_19530 [Anaerolineaceae bacterium]|nr:hypothetical protein [Anaerolineaceae bacterium]